MPVFKVKPFEGEGGGGGGTEVVPVLPDNAKDGDIVLLKKEKPNLDDLEVTIYCESAETYILVIENEDAVKYGLSDGTITDEILQYLSNKINYKSNQEETIDGLVQANQGMSPYFCTRYSFALDYPEDETIYINSVTELIGKTQEDFDNYYYLINMGKFKLIDIVKIAEYFNAPGEEPITSYITFLLSNDLDNNTLYKVEINQNSIIFYERELIYNTQEPSPSTVVTGISDWEISGDGDDKYQVVNTLEPNTYYNIEEKGYEQLEEWFENIPEEYNQICIYMLGNIVKGEPEYSYHLYSYFDNKYNEIQTAVEPISNYYYSATANKYKLRIDPASSDYEDIILSFDKLLNLIVKSGMFNLPFGKNGVDTYRTSLEFIKALNDSQTPNDLQQYSFGFNAGAGSYDGYFWFILQSGETGGSVQVQNLISLEGDTLGDFLIRNKSALQEGFNQQPLTTLYTDQFVDDASGVDPNIMAGYELICRAYDGEAINKTFKGSYNFNALLNMLYKDPFTND